MVTTTTTISVNIDTLKKLQYNKKTIHES